MITILGEGAEAKIEIVEAGEDGQAGGEVKGPEELFSGKPVKGDDHRYDLTSRGQLAGKRGMDLETVFEKAQEQKAEQDKDVAANDDHREPFRKKPPTSPQKINGIEQQLVGDRIKQGPKLGLLFQGPSQEAVQGVA